MPTYPHIMAEIARTPWAISADALAGLVAATRGNLGAHDYPAFHRAPEGDQQAVAGILGQRINNTTMSFQRDRVGFLQINGPIIPHADSFAESSGVVSVEGLSRELAALEADDTVDQIVMVIDSPGGAVTGISEFSKTVKAVSKPVIAYIYGHAASAAYWIASAADLIVMGDTSAVGSIGVVMTIWKGEDDEVEIVSSQSPNKRPDVDTDEGREELQTMVDQLADVFIGAVARNRGVTAKDVVSKFGAGGMKLSKAAVAAGMADREMTLAEFVEGVTTGGAVNMISKFDKSSTAEEKEKVTLSQLEDNKMNLTEFLKEHPEAAAEIDKIKADAFAKGGEQTAKEINERNSAASKILSSDAYPEQIKTLASKVITGENSANDLSLVVTMFDAMTAKNETDAAAEDTKKTPATPAQNIDAPSTDGVLRNAADIDAASAAMKAGR